MNYNEYLKNRTDKSGRKTGTEYINKKRDVYSALKNSGKISVDYSTFNRVLNAVAEKVWDAVYAGHHVAIPYLFNMEVVVNTVKWPKRVDWKRTHEWWETDEEAFKDRLLLRSNPTRYFLRIKHSTISHSRKQWYWPLMLEVRPSKGRVREIETKYQLQ